MDPTQIAVMLASPLVVAVVGVLLWWRVGQMEKEIVRLRETKEAMALDVARMQGAIDSLRSLFTEVLQAALGRRHTKATTG